MREIPFFPNPYDILNITTQASKGEIIKAVNVAMKQKKYPVKVIAEAQKILMNPQKRALADYLRPLIPTVDSFTKGDFSALSQSEKNLSFIRDFDDLKIEEPADAFSLSSLNISEPEQALTEGITAYKQKNYQLAIKYLEAYSKSCQDSTSKTYLKAQTKLIKAYEMLNQPSKAISLCEQLSRSDNPQIKVWAEEELKKLS